MNLTYCPNFGGMLIRKVVDSEIGNGKYGIYLRCEKPKTPFDTRIFKEQTGLAVPENILNEIENNSTGENVRTWNSEVFSQLGYGPDFIKSKKCLSKEDAEMLLEKARTRKNILSVGHPVFDNASEHCIISADYRMFEKSTYGHTYFLKKTCGVWTVVLIYDTWMS